MSKDTESSVKELEKEGEAALAALDEREDLEPNEAKVRAMDLQEKRAHFIQVLSRGVVNDRLNVKAKVPKGRRALWVRDRDEDIQRIVSLGGRLETTDEIGEAGLHGAGDNRIRVGDVVLMSISQEDHEILQDIKAEWTRNRLSAARNEAKGKMKQTGLDVIDNSATHIERSSVE